MLGRIKKFCLEVYKIFIENTPSYMNDLITFKNTEYDLRNQHCVIPYKNTTRYGLHSFSYYAAHVFNTLPNDYKHVENINQFKNLIKSWAGPHCSCNICNVIL